MTTDEVLLNYSNLREQFADQAHESWSGWMKYLFKQGTFGDKGSVIIPKDLVVRWHGQMNTPYADLSEKEKVSDRKEADAYLEILMKGM